MKYIPILLFILFTVNSQAQTTIQGVVYHDKNANGLRDRDEPGLAGAMVSDQVQVVITDAQGRYELASAGYGFVLVTPPDGYAANPWWQKVSTTNNFALKKVPTSTTFSFIHASDTHISEKSLDRMEKLRAVVEAAKPDFVLISGDLVKDALRVSEQEASGYFTLFRQELAKFTVPVWSVPGNHEIFGIERHLSLVSKSHPLYGKRMFHHYLGPNYYSFNYGGIHFVGLDNVDYEDLWYFGRVDSLQLKWLKADLASVAATTPVITFGHMPFYSGGLSFAPFTETGPSRTLERENGKLEFRHVVSNAADVLKVLTTHPYPLSLAGHHHARQVFWYESTSTKIRFEQTGAVVGGTPHGNETLPSGVTLYKVTNGVVGEGTFIPLDKK